MFNLVQLQFQKCFFKILGLLLFLIAITSIPKAFASDNDNENPMERVETTGTSIAGTSLILTCRGSECRGTAIDLAAEINEMFKKQTSVLIDDEEEAGIKRDFCSRLKKKVPQQCEQFESTPWPYSSLLNTGPWTWVLPPLTNGCGTGGNVEMGAKMLFKATSNVNFSGNLDEPITGFNFLNACNNHDMCYANGTSQTACDDAFTSELEQVKNNQGVICENNRDCETMIFGYTFAVRYFGDKAMAQAKVEKTCRTFKDDYARNCARGSGSGGSGLGGSGLGEA